MCIYAIQYWIQYGILYIKPTGHTTTLKQRWIDNEFRFRRWFNVDLTFIQLNVPAGKIFLINMGKCTIYLTLLANWERKITFLAHLSFRWAIPIGRRPSVCRAKISQFWQLASVQKMYLQFWKTTRSFKIEVF